MDLDKGLARKLPPVEKNKQEESIVNKDNIIKVYITGNNKILVDDEPSTLDELKSKLKKFVVRKGRNHLIQLQASENANYDTYFHVQDTIVSIFNQLKNQLISFNKNTGKITVLADIKDFFWLDFDSETKTINGYNNKEQIEIAILE